MARVDGSGSLADAGPVRRQHLVLSGGRTSGGRDDLVTELRVENEGPGAADADLTFVPADGVGAARHLRLSLNGRETVEILDLFARWPAKAAGAGVLLLESRKEDARLKAVARTYSRASVTPARVSRRRVGPARSMAVAVQEPSRTAYFPVVARTRDGAERFVTFDASVTNPGPGPVEVRMSFLQDGLDNSAALSVLLWVGPGQTRVLEDVSYAFFGLAGVSGYIKLESASPVLATGRLVVREQGGPDLAARTILPIRPERFSYFSSLSGTRPGDLVDSRIGLLNPADSPEPVLVRIWTQAGELMGKTSVLVPARGSLEVDPAAILSSEAAPQSVLGWFLTTESPRTHFSFSF